jgi:hypothetical protein
MLDVDVVGAVMSAFFEKFKVIRAFLTLNPGRRVIRSTSQVWLNTDHVWKAPMHKG